MTDQHQEAPQHLDSETVAAYLRLHPEFFVQHEELIPELRIPHQPGEAVSLVERQVKLLRERNIEMRHRLSQLMDVARENDRLFDKTASNLQEVVARGGKVILLSDQRGCDQLAAYVHTPVVLPEVDPFVAPLLYAIPVQLLAYHTAVLKGTDVDQPRNLAKSVTVE